MPAGLVNRQKRKKMYFNKSCSEAVMTGATLRTPRLTFSLSYFPQMDRYVYQSFWQHFHCCHLVEDLKGNPGKTVICYKN